MSKVVPLIESIFENKGNSPELWNKSIELLLQRRDEAYFLLKYMKKKINELNKENQLLALDFLDFIIDEGKMHIWTQISSKSFLNILVNILKNGNDNDIKGKILFLIEKWGTRFEKYYSIMPNFTSYYKTLKDKEIIFPKNYQSTYFFYLGNNNKFDFQLIDNLNYNLVNNNNNNDIKLYSKNIYLNINNHERKYRKLILKLNESIDLINTAQNIMEKNQLEKLNNLEDIINELLHNDQQLIETIQGERLKDEILMDASLKVSDDIKKIISKYHDFKINDFNNIQIKNSIDNFDILKGFDNFDNQIHNNQENINNKQINNSNKIEDNINDLFEIFSKPSTVNNQNQNNNTGINTQIQNNNMNDIFNDLNQNKKSNNNNNINNIFNNNNNVEQHFNLLDINNNQTQNNQNNLINLMMNNNVNNDNNMINNNNFMNVNNQNNNEIDLNFNTDIKSNNNQSNDILDFGISNEPNQNEFNTNMKINNNDGFVLMNMNNNNNQNNQSNDNNIFGNFNFYINTNNNNNSNNNNNNNNNININNNNNNNNNNNYIGGQNINDLFNIF